MQITGQRRGGILGSLSEAWARLSVCLPQVLKDRTESAQSWGIRHLLRLAEKPS